MSLRLMHARVIVCRCIAGRSSGHCLHDFPSRYSGNWEGGATTPGESLMCPPVNPLLICRMRPLEGRIKRRPKHSLIRPRLAKQRRRKRRLRTHGGEPSWTACRPSPEKMFLSGEHAAGLLPCWFCYVGALLLYENDVVWESVCGLEREYWQTLAGV